MNTLLLAVFLLGSAVPQEGPRYPAKPGPRDFILDEAKLLKPDDAAEIRILCDEVLTKKKAPIIVVTIPSLAAYGAGGWPIERYALNLMSEWGVGWPEWNYGMLLLVSIGDRKARNELGGSWERRKDDDAKRVMSERIIPHFKKGDPSKGVLEGVRGLHDIALDAVASRAQPKRGAPVPAPAPAPVPGATWSGLGCLPVLLVIVVGGVILMFVFRMLRRGSVTSWGNRGPYGGGSYGGGGGGFGSSFGGGLLGGALGSMLGGAVSRRYDSPSPPPPASYGGSDSSSSSSSDSSDYGGGSFGGGFSGGGGATGEW
jgi:uncharacterized protein